MSVSNRAELIAGYADVLSDPATDDAEVVKRLRAAGAVILGITAMPEFGIWPFTETSAHGYTRNPWNILHSTAGSSGGTASAVASATWSSTGFEETRTCFTSDGWTPTPRGCCC